MATGKAKIACALVTVLLVSACGGSEEGPRLMNLRSTHNGPDEFAILPTKPLQIPTDMAQLPTPRPGGANLVDPQPLNDAVVALGGRPGAGGGDAALVAAAGRNGVSGGIREQLAAEDAEFRSKQSPRPLERLFGTSTYHRAYDKQSTDVDRELNRARAAGAKTPSAPPPSAR